MTNERVRTEIFEKAARNGIELNLFPFVTANFTAQVRRGPLVRGFRDQMSAEDYALKIYNGRTDVYVTSAKPEHGLIQVINGTLVDLS